MVGYAFGKAVALFEVEKKNAWGDQEYPFRTLRIPHRKQKFIWYDLPTVFCVFNCSMDRMAFVTKGVLRKCRVNKHKFDRGEEFFFEIRLNQVNFLRRYRL